MNLKLAQAVPDADAEVARRALPSVKRLLAHQPGPVLSITGEGLGDGVTEVPRQAMELLAGILANLAAGRIVQLVPGHAELTTQQAADLLNVSRPFLIGLLTAGEIEYRMVGTHRRVKADSLMDYLREDDKRRRGAADELADLSETLGLV